MPRFLRGWPPRLLFGNLDVFLRCFALELRAEVRQARSAAGGSRSGFEVREDLAQEWERGRVWDGEKSRIDACL